jgi:hypothetical protein
MGDGDILSSLQRGPFLASIVLANLLEKISLIPNRPILWVVSMMTAARDYPFSGVKWSWEQVWWRNKKSHTKG